MEPKSCAVFVILVLIPSLQQLCCSGKKFKKTTPSKVFVQKPGTGYCLDANNLEATARRHLAGTCTQAEQACRVDQFCVAYACSNSDAMLYSNTSCLFNCDRTEWIQNASLITHAGFATGYPNLSHFEEAECYVEVATGAAAATAPAGPFGNGYLVTELNNKRVSYCEQAASVCTTVAGTSGVQGNGAGEFAQPMGLDIASDGTFFLVADSYNHRIQRCPASLNASQNCTTVAGGTGIYGGSDATSLRNPSDVAVEAQGSFLVNDASNHRVVRCSSSGSSGSACTNVAGTGTAGTGVNQLYHPESVAIESNGDFLVADRYNQRVQRCPADGSGATTGCTTVAGIVSTQGTNSTTFNDPYCVESESNGNFLVCDQHNYRIQRCPASGSGPCSTVAGTTGSSGSSLPQMNKPYAVLAESDGSFKVADPLNSRVLHCTNGNCSISGASGWVAASGNDGLAYPRGLAAVR